MKKYKICIALLACFLVVFSSCEMKKDLFGGIEDPSIPKLPENAGLLDLSLLAEKEADIPSETRSNDNIETGDLFADDFSVVVYDSAGVKAAYFETYAEMKSEGGAILSPGKYTIQAEKGEDVIAAFDKPFYTGKDTFVIETQKVSKVETPCVLTNKKVTFRCTDTFLESFNEDYSIVLDNGVGILNMNKEEERSAYLRNTGLLRMGVYVTTKDGEQIVYNMDLSNNNQIQEHNNILIDLDIVDNGNEPGDGGETDPEEPTDPGDEDKPEIPTDKPVIRVDITLIEKDFIIEIPSEDIGGDTDPEPGEDGIVVSGIVDGSPLDFSQTYTITSSTKMSITFKFPTGIEAMNAIVNIGPDNLNIDMFNPPSDLEEVLAGVALPEKGMKSYTFDLSPFMSLMTMIQGEHSFDITVKDMNGETARKVLKVKVP